jgi:hypothetical protein
LAINGRVFAALVLRVVDGCHDRRLNAALGAAVRVAGLAVNHVERVLGLAPGGSRRRAAAKKS